MNDELKLPRLARDLFGTEIEARFADGGPFEVTFSASSEAPVERFFGEEVLSHRAGHVRMERLNGGAAPLLFNHNWDDPVGMLTGGRLKDGRLVVDARFFDTDRAREVKSMLDGGLRNVSIGYEIHDMEETGKNRYRATDWTLLEASIVTIPADPGVGIGRSAEDQVAKPVRITRMETTPAQPAIIKEAIMAENQNAPAGAIADIQVTENGAPAQRMNMLEIEGKRKQAIENLCNANRLDARFAREWIAGGASLEQVADDMIKIMQERGKDQMPAGIGMSKKETAQYSVTRALRAAMSKDWSKAGMELEAHKAVMSAHGVNARSGSSFFVPMEVQARSLGVGRRDMTVAGVSGSQYLVSTDNQPGNFIDLLRNDSVVLSMGATRLTGLVGNITIPKMTAGGTAYWLADESTQITESQATIGQLSLSPKNVAALTEISHQLMSQSSPDVETMVMNDLAQVLALAVDVAAIRGSGAGQPQGIVGTVGVGTFDTDSTNTFSDVLDAQVDVMAANALRPGCAYVADPASAALLMGRSRFANTDTPIWNGSLLEGTMAGFPCRATNQMSANTMLFGLWPSVVVAEWGPLELMVNPYSDFTRGLSAVRAWYAIDTGMRYPAAFSYDATVA
jgi:HK97 family phage major capsid protein/HK97 family phage prohead protease